LPIKLIAMDIDGTLLNGHSLLPPENARAIAEAAARGIEIVIVTGRRFHSARMIASQLPCSVELITSNGALIKSISGETHVRSPLPVVTARLVLEATSDFRPFCGVIFDRPRENQLIFEHVDWAAGFMGAYLSRHPDHVAEVVPLTACLDSEDPVEVMFIADCPTIRRVIRELETHQASQAYSISLTEYPRSDVSMLDVLNRGVTKGAAVAEWARRRGIRREDVMAIGDNWNDREMLDYAGLPVIMGNSPDELKSFGWKTTRSNDECGVAEAIRTYVLTDQPDKQRD
jgi:hypothetical protein